MPTQEVTRSVDAQGILHVHGDKIVETGFSTGVLRRGKFGRGLGDAEDGCDVGAPFSGSGIAPRVLCVLG